jgi:hypothetical protein
MCGKLRARLPKLGRWFVMPRVWSAPTELFLGEMCYAIAAKSIARNTALIACALVPMLLAYTPTTAWCMVCGDDNDCVIALEALNARFERDDEGFITAVTVGARTTDAALVYLKGLPHLRRLSFVCALRLTDDGLAHLEELKSLEFLWFGYSNITDGGMVHLRGLNNLKELFVGIDRSDFGDNGLMYLRELKSLRKLTLVKTQVTKDALRELQEHLPECRIAISR